MVLRSSMEFLTPLLTDYFTESLKRSDWLNWNSKITFKFAPEIEHSGFAVYALSPADKAQAMLERQTAATLEHLKDCEFSYYTLLDPKGTLQSLGLVLKPDLQKSDALYMVAFDQAPMLPSRLKIFCELEDVQMLPLVNASLTLSRTPCTEVLETPKNTLEFYFDKTKMAPAMMRYAQLLLPKDGTPSEIVTSPLAGDRDLEVFNSGGFLLPKWRFHQILNFHPWLTQLYSVQKGCFPGQEVVAKLTTRQELQYEAGFLVRWAETSEQKALKENAPDEAWLTFKNKMSRSLLPNSELCIPGELKDCPDELLDLLKSHPLAGSERQNLRACFELSFVEVEKSFRVPWRWQHCEHAGEMFYFAFIPFKELPTKELAQRLADQAAKLFLDNSSQQALHDYALAWSLNPLETQYLESLTVLLGREECYQVALKLCDEWAKLEPTAVLPMTNKSLFLMKTGHIEAAEQAKGEATFRSFLEAGKTTQKPMTETMDLAKRDQLEKKARMFEEVVAIDAEDAFALKNLAQVYFDLHQYDKSLLFVEKLLTLNKFPTEMQKLKARVLKVLDSQ